MQYEAAKPKGVSRNEDAPKQEPMRGSDSQVRRNPSTDQKKVRRQMAKKSAYDIFFANSKIAVRGSCINCGTNMVVPEDSSFPKCDNCTKNDPAIGTPDRPYDREKDPGFTGSRRTANRGDRNLGYGDFDGPEDDDDDDDKERDEDHLEYNPLDEIERWERRASRKTAESENPWWAEQREMIHGLQHGESMQFIRPDGVEHNISYHEHVPDNDFGNKAYGYKAGVFTVEGPKGTEYHRVSPFQEHETSQKAYAADNAYHTIMRNYRGPQTNASRKIAGLNDIVGRTDNSGDPNCLHCAYDKGNADYFEGSQPISREDLADYKTDWDDEYGISQTPAGVNCATCGDDIEEAADKAFKLRAPRKTPNNKTTSSNKNATLIPTQVQNLTPQDYILHPITQGNEKIRRTRSFETQGDEAYVDTDSGTSSPVKRNQTVVRNPYNMSQIELPSTGIPGGNSNVIPFGRQHDPSANKPSAKESKCPRDGTMMTLQKGGNTYKCSTCGLVETVRGAGGLNFSDAPSVNKAAIKNNRRTASAIAQRARQVLDLEENQ